jgi:hypothetical protein
VEGVAVASGEVMHFRMQHEFVHQQAVARFVFAPNEFEDVFEFVDYGRAGDGRGQLGVELVGFVDEAFEMDDDEALDVAMCAELRGVQKEGGGLSDSAAGLDYELTLLDPVAEVVANRWIEGRRTEGCD